MTRRGKLPPDAERKVVKAEQLTSMKALWLRDKDEVRTKNTTSFTSIFPMTGRTAAAHPGQDGRHTGIPAAAVHPGEGALRHDDAGGHAKAWAASVYQARVYHGRLHRTAAGLPAVCEGRGGFGGPAVEHLPRTAAGEQADTAHEQGACGQGAGCAQGTRRETPYISGEFGRILKKGFRTRTIGRPP